mmetsp:Transcript_13749/g.25938  ORF Transcript_13749/g.25938 Transcript_13749/m.25938 type:complete len:170 (+) Transcript_13749:38-547(+)
MMLRLTRRLFADVATHAPGKIPKVVEKIVWLNVEDADGNLHVIPGIEGENLMYTLRDYSVAIPGLCEGGDRVVPEIEEPRDYLSAGPYCDTCQVIIENPWNQYLKPMGEWEQERITRAIGHVTPNTRLSCVLLIEKWMNGMHLYVPFQTDEMPEAKDMGVQRENRHLTY